MPRFVLLEHDHPAPHIDLLLEMGDVLWAWRLERPPEEGTALAAVRNFDHRLLYLDYEGPVSGGRGRVRRWDHGTFDWQTREESRVEVVLQGQRLRGQLRLEQEGEGWRVEFVAGRAGSVSDRRE